MGPVELPGIRKAGWNLGSDVPYENAKKPKYVWGYSELRVVA